MDWVQLTGAVLKSLGLLDLGGLLALLGGSLKGWVSTESG